MTSSHRISTPTVSVSRLAAAPREVVHHISAGRAALRIPVLGEHAEAHVLTRRHREERPPPPPSPRRQPPPLPHRDGPQRRMADHRQQGVQGLGSFITRGLRPRTPSPPRSLALTSLKGPSAPSAIRAPSRR